MLAPWSRTSSLPKCKEYILVVSPPGLWYFVMAAQARLGQVGKLPAPGALRLSKHRIQDATNRQTEHPYAADARIWSIESEAFTEDFIFKSKICNWFYPGPIAFSLATIYGSSNLKKPSGVGDNLGIFFFQQIAPWNDTHLSLPLRFYRANNHGGFTPRAPLPLRFFKFCQAP